MVSLEHAERMGREIGREIPLDADVVTAGELIRERARRAVDGVTGPPPRRPRLWPWTLAYLGLIVVTLGAPRLLPDPSGIPRALDAALAWGVLGVLVVGGLALMVVTVRSRLRARRYLQVHTGSAAAERATVMLRAAFAELDRRRAEASDDPS